MMGFSTVQVELFLLYPSLCKKSLIFADVMYHADKNDITGKASQAALLERIRQGDTHAFDTVYRQSYGSLCRLAIFILHDRALAEEIADDVMYYLWDHRQEAEVSNLNAWLLKAVRNKSINALKSASMQAREATDSISDADRHDLLAQLFDDEHPLEKLIAEEMEEQIRAAIDRLPEDTRRVFILCKMNGKKYAEAAQELGISVNTVKYHMKNAMKIMESIMKKYLLIYLILQYL